MLIKRILLTFLVCNFLLGTNLYSQPTDQIQKIISADIASYDKFGISVSISGDYALIGASEDDDNGNLSGAAYIYFNNNGIWEQTAKLLPSDGASYDYFGCSVCINGDMAIVGAYMDDDVAVNSGSVYLFSKDQGGIDNWGQVVKLTASDPQSDDYFGSSVGLSFDHVVVGAYRKNSFEGTAYVFFNNNGTWEQQSILNASDGAAGDSFGKSVAISGDCIAIGAEGDDDNGTSSGSAYIFYKDAGGLNNWGQQKKITALDAAAGDMFGCSVSIENTAVIIGSRYDYLNGGNKGSSYIFNKDLGGTDNWGQIKKIIASDGVNSSYFGSSVSISGNYALVGAYGYDIYQAAYLFSKDQGGIDNWGEISKLVSNDNASEDRFGFSVGISANYAVIGAPQNDENGTNSGAVYIFGSPMPSITTQPEPWIGICPNSEVVFSISGDDITSYQWQVSEDSGNTWDNISDNSTYSGTATNILTIESNSGLLNSLYICQVSNTIGSVNSNIVYFSYETENPVIVSFPDNQIIGDGTSCEVLLPDYIGDVITTDNCDVNPAVTQSPEAGTLISGATNTVTLTVTDDVGNTAEVTFNVTVEDNTNPEITSTHTDQTVDANAECEAILSDYTGDVIASDNCDSNIDITQNPIVGTVIFGTLNTVTLTVTDNSGNTDEVTFNIAVEDNTSPEITSTHEDKTVDANADCEANLSDYTGYVIAIDNCDAFLDIIQNPIAGTTVSGVTNQITLSVTDNAGNIDEVAFNVAVEDNTNPVITCVGNQTVDADETHNYSVQGTEFNPLSTIDNCEVASIENDFNNSSTLEGVQIPEGTTSIVWTVADNTGNVNTCSFDITVNAFVGIEKVHKTGISIYPIPTSGICYFKSSDNNIKKLTISDLTGKILIEKTTINQNETLDLSSFESGIYTIRIQADSEVFITKLIKE
jgi:hypothetical protein